MERTNETDQCSVVHACLHPISRVIFLQGMQPDKLGLSKVRAAHLVVLVILVRYLCSKTPGQYCMGANRERARWPVDGTTWGST